MYTTESSYHDNSVGNPDIWANWIAQWNPGDAQAIAESYFRNCAIVSLNADLCLAQASLETAHFTSTRYTAEKNMAGVGITADNTNGFNFGTIEGGVKGHLAHLCAYVYDAANNPQFALADNDSQWRDVRGGNNGHNPFNDGIPYIHTLEQPDKNEGPHRWAASGWSYVPNIIAVANTAVGVPVPVQPVPQPPPVKFPVSQPTILHDDTSVNIWSAGEWGGRSQYPVRAIVLHVMGGTYIGSINWFKNSAAQASANYAISYGGEITECVNPDETAPWANGISNGNNTDLPTSLKDIQWGNPNANFITVSIEHEGNPFDPDFPHVEEWNSSVQLTAYLCTKYNLHPSRDTILPHRVFDTVNRPNCIGPHVMDKIDQYINEVITAMNIPNPVNLDDPMGIESADGVYRTFHFIPGSPTLGHSIYKYWMKNGEQEALWRLGYPLTSEVTETREDGSTIVCNWCERSRIEWHPEHQGTNSEVQEGLIGEEMMEFHKLPIPGAERTTFPIDTKIQSYYDAHGGLEHFGYPLTSTTNYPTDNILGQWFERGYIEIHDDGLVVGRRLGAEALEARQSGNGPGIE